ncbi:MAG: AMP-binding protein, partial [Candidatus Aminicenantes bacterium]
MKGLDKKNIQDIFALTPMQAGMLFHYLKNPDSDLYIEQLSLEITGEIDIRHFQNAWKFVSETNEMLRAVFHWENVEKPFQIILKTHELKVIFSDISDKEDWERELRLESLKFNHRKEISDLRDVPFRVMLCKVEKARYEMIISNHHILYDGWSNGIILREFFNAYHDLVEGKQPEIPIKTKFKEFTRWYQNRDEDKEKEFWGDYLKEFNTQTGLSIKQRRKIKDNPCPQKYCARFATDVFDQLKAFVNMHKITLASVLYSVWGLLLQGYNDSADVIFGTTVSGRSAKIQGIEDIVGLFINTIPLRIQGIPNEKTRDFLVRINKTLQIREPYEATPLVNIKEYSEIDGEGELFDSIVVIENYPLDTKIMEENNGLTVESYSTVEMPHYDLTLGITINGDLELSFIYDEETLADDAIIRLSQHFQGMIKDIITNPDREISAVEIISEEERSQVLYEFNHPLTGYPGDKTIHEWFAEQAEKTPDRVALIGNINPKSEIQNSKQEGTRGLAPLIPISITYRRLNQQSDQLAWLLIEEGVKPDSIVGMMVERSIDMIIGIMGILKAGGAYLPIDADYPDERIDFMLRDSNVGVLVTTQKAQVKVKAEVKGRFIDCQVSPTNLAYIIYTSGSTGKPKGVAVNHYSVIAYIYAFYQEFKITSQDTVMQQSSCSFDAFVEEVYPILLRGGRLAIPGKHEILDIGLLSGFIVRHHVNIISCSPLLLNELNKYEPSRLIGVHTFISGGDELHAQYISNLLKIGMVYNTYGPTETTVCAAYYRCPSNRDNRGPGIPIGKPIRNYNVLILDRNNKLLPIQIAGELCIMGAGLARGYLNNPELTAQKFQTNIAHELHELHETNNEKFLRGGPGAPRRGEPKKAKCFAPYAVRHAP